MKRLLLILLLAPMFTFAQKPQNENTSKVILITIDGLRWQELFKGADKELISNNLYVKILIN